MELTSPDNWVGKTQIDVVSIVCQILGPQKPLQPVSELQHVE